MTPPTPHTPQELAVARRRFAELRAQVDELNSELLDLLERRAAVVLEIAQAKRTLGMAPFDPAREEEMLEDLEHRNPGPLAGEDVRAIFSAVFHACLALQHRLREPAAPAARPSRHSPATAPEPTRP